VSKRAGARAFRRLVLPRRRVPAGIQAARLRDIPAIRACARERERAHAHTEAAASARPYEPRSPSVRAPFERSRVWRERRGFCGGGRPLRAVPSSTDHPSRTAYAARTHARPRHVRAPTRGRAHTARPTPTHLPSPRRAPVRRERARACGNARKRTAAIYE